MTAIILIGSGIAKLGFMANFLSQPILTGYLNGVAIIILVGQFPKLLGYSVEAEGFLEEVVAIVRSLGKTHLPTLIMGVLFLSTIVAIKRMSPLLPGPLFVVIGGIVAVKVFGLEEYGIAVLGEVPAGLPTFRLHGFDPKVFGNILTDASGIALVSFTSGVLTAKSFARKSHQRRGRKRGPGPRPRRGARCLPAASHRGSRQ